MASHVGFAFFIAICIHRFVVCLQMQINCYPALLINPWCHSYQGANHTPPDGTTPQPGAERSLPVLAPAARRIYIRPSGGLAFGSDDGHATSKRRIVGEIAPKFERELPLCPHLKIYKKDTGLLSEYCTRVAVSAYYILLPLCDVYIKLLIFRDCHSYACSFMSLGKRLCRHKCFASTSSL